MKKGVYLLWMVIGFGLMVFIFGRNVSMFNTQNDEANAVTYVKTTGTVKEIVRAGVTRRQRQTQVLVNFKTTDGKSFDGVISLMRWPFVGSVADKGDEVSVYYNPQKPQMARSIYDEYNFIFANIFFVLVGLCILIFVITSFIRMFRSKPDTGQKTE